MTQVDINIVLACTGRILILDPDLMLAGGLFERQSKDECGCDARTQAVLHCVQRGNSKQGCVP